MGERQELQDVLLILLKFELGEKRQNTVPQSLGTDDVPIL